MVLQFQNIIERTQIKNKNESTKKKSITHTEQEEIGKNEPNRDRI